MQSIELDVFYHSDETRSLDDIGIAFDWDDLETRKITFYNIDAISPHKVDNEFLYSKIFIGGEIFICNKHYNELKSLIEAQCVGG